MIVLLAVVEQSHPILCLAVSLVEHLIALGTLTYIFISPLRDRSAYLLQPPSSYVQYTTPKKQALRGNRGHKPDIQLRTCGVSRGFLNH
jgi:hypothetical protein